MGILKDLYDIAHNNSPDFDIDDVLGDDTSPISRVQPVSYDSIAKQAKNGVMQFPIIASRSISFEDMQMVSKACERNFASFLQVVFTMNQITSADNPQEFVNQYHQNMRNNIKGAGDLIGLVFNSADIPHEVRNQVMTALKEGSVSEDVMFELKTLDEKFTPINIKEIMLYEAQGGTPANAAQNAGEEENTDDNNGSGNNPNNGRHGPHGGRQNNNNGNNNRNGGNTTYNTSIKLGGGGGSKPYNPHHELKRIPDNVFVDNDAKKANELIPTLLRVRILKDMGDESKWIEFIVGVKAMIHPVDSKDMIDHVVEALRDRGKLFKFIRWTTGELSFFKDLIFNIDQAKRDVTEIKAGTASTWWRTLKNIKASRRFHKWTRTSPVLPNATLVMSMEEVDFIKANYSFDITEDAIAERIIESFSLLQFVIVDHAADVCYFYADGDDRYNVVTYKGLERENGNADKQFKEILSAVNKLR